MSNPIIMVYILCEIRDYIVGIVISPRVSGGEYKLTMPSGQAQLPVFQSWSLEARLSL